MARAGNFDYFRLVRDEALGQAKAGKEAVQTIWSGPTEPHDMLGLAQQNVVEVMEQKKIWRAGKKEIWLRLRPLGQGKAAQGSSAHSTLLSCNVQSHSN